MSTLRIGWAFAISGLAACTGTIDDPPSEAPLPPVDPGSYQPEPVACDGADYAVTGRTGTRRLNRAELASAVRSLFGEAEGIEELWPADVAIDGYDTNAEGLSTSEEHARQWFSVTEALAERAIAPAALAAPPAATVRREAESIQGSYCPERSAPGYANLCFETSVYDDFSIAAAGDHRIAVRAFGERAGDELPRMRVLVDGAIVHEVEVASESDTPTTFEVEVDHRRSGSVGTGFRTR